MGVSLSAAAGAGDPGRLGGEMPFGSSTRTTSSMAGRSVGGASVASSSRPSTVTMRSMLHSSVASITRPTGSVEVRVPDEGLLFYLPYSQAEPFPCVASNRPLLKLAIEDSKLGSIPELAPNAYYVTDEWAETLKRDAEGRFAKLYYVVEGEAYMSLKTGEKQELIRQAVNRSGYCHVPKQAANVFFVKAEWREALKSSGAEALSLRYVVKGDATRKVFTVESEEQALLQQAITEGGCEHVVGLEPYGFYVSVRDHEKISEEYKRRTYVHPLKQFLLGVAAGMSSKGSDDDYGGNWGYGEGHAGFE